MFETIINNGEGEGGPKLSNPNKQFMKVESVSDGLSFPTSRNSSTMKWNIRGQPVLEVQVENEAERGLLGVAILNDDLRNNKKTRPSNN